MVINKAGIVYTHYTRNAGPVIDLFISGREQILTNGEVLTATRPQIFPQQPSFGAGEAEDSKRAL